jgi:hypothetical protein
MKLPEALTSLLGKAKAGGAKDNQVVTLPPDIFVTTQASHLYNSHLYRLTLKIALGEALICAVLIIVAIIMMAQAKPTDRFFVSAANGRLERVMPLDTPLQTDTEILSLVADNVASSLTFGYIDREQRQRLTSDPFATGIPEKLQVAVVGKERLAALSTQALVFKAAVDPSLGGGILKKGREGDNIYRWQMQLPIQLQTISGSGALPEQKQPWHILVKVERARTLDLGLSYQIIDILGAQPAGPPQVVKSAPAPGGTP